MLVAPSARQRCSITKTDKWLKLLTLPLPISKCLQVSTMFAWLTAGLIKNVWRTWGPALPTLLADLMIFCPLGPTNFKNSVVLTRIYILTYLPLAHLFTTQVLGVNTSHFCSMRHHGFYHYLNFLPLSTKHMRNWSN